MMNFSPPSWLGNTHVQTVLGSSPARSAAAFLAARRMLKASASVILDCGDGVRLQGYHAPSRQEGADLCILIHGWQGSAESAYIISAANRLWRAGFSVFRLNLRDHGMTHHLNEGVFHSCRIDEVVGAVKRIQESFAHKHLFLCGFSLGGNFALRVALRAPAAGIRLLRVVAVCPVLSPRSTMDALETGPRIYHDHFMKSWIASLERKYRIFPHLEPLKEVRRYKRSIRALTDYFVKNLTELADIDAYLDGYAITGDVLKPLSVPSLVVAALDDPIIPAKDLANLAKTETLEIEAQRFGGHCAFIQNIALCSWMDPRIAAELSKAASA